MSKVDIEMEMGDAKWLSGWLDTLLSGIPTDQMLGDALNMSRIARVLRDAIAGEPKADDIAGIYAYYLEQFHKSDKVYKLTPKRRQKIKLRLKDAGDEMLTQAIHNVAITPFYNGDNDRNWKADLDFITRSYEQVERLANMTAESDKPDLNNLGGDMETLI